MMSKVFVAENGLLDCDNLLKIDSFINHELIVSKTCNSHLILCMMGIHIKVEQEALV